MDGAGLCHQFLVLFDLLLRAVNGKHARIVVLKPVVGSIVHKGWAYQHHVVELASKRASQLVNKVLGFAGGCRAHDQCFKRNVVFVRLYFNVAKTRAVCP